MAKLQTIEANNDFAKHMYMALARGENNVVFSPISAHAVLAMAYQGASGSTKEAFAETLRLPDSTLAADGYQEIMDRLNNTQGLSLHIANKAYIKEGYKLQSAFEETAREKFRSEVQSINFLQTEAAARTINAWVCNKTGGMIQNIVSPMNFSALTSLVLVNAIYFKAHWASPFSAERTNLKSFYITQENRIDCQMMHKKGYFNYKLDNELDAKVLEMPYRNKEFSMLFILPNKMCDIKGLEEKFLKYDVNKIRDNMYNVEVQVAIPRFKIEQTINLNGILSMMGLEEIFNPYKCDLSQMIEDNEPLMVNEVRQKVFLEVDEKGVRAAAATSMGFLFGGPAPPKPPPMKFYAKHPFIIMLVDKSESPCVLFLGKIARP